jgi:hypothetical protein
MTANIKDIQWNAAFLSDSVTKSSRKIYLKIYSMGSWFQWCICLKVVGKTANHKVSEHLDFTDRVNYITRLLRSIIWKVRIFTWSAQFYLIFAVITSDPHYYLGHLFCIWKVFVLCGVHLSSCNFV